MNPDAPASKAATMCSMEESSSAMIIGTSDFSLLIALMTSIQLIFSVYQFRIAKSWEGWFATNSSRPRALFSF